MTYEEAIKILDEFGGCCSSDLEYIATHKVINAIEKQIQKNHNALLRRLTSLWQPVIALRVIILSLRTIDIVVIVGRR